MQIHNGLNRKILLLIGKQEESEPHHTRELEAHSSLNVDDILHTKISINEVPDEIKKSDKRE